MTGRVALIAGEGSLPRLLFETLSGAGVVPEVHALAGFAPEGLESVPFRADEIGGLIVRLRAGGVGRVCFCGAVRRPETGAPLALDGVLRQGDDGLLGTLARVFEGAGLAIVGAHELMPALVAPPPGSMPPELGPDAARGRAVLDALGPLDVGQACVVAAGQVLGIETVQGTEELLRFVARTRRGTGGVLVKRPKPGQDLRFDMPAIGPDTIDQVQAARLAGIALAAGRVLILERARTLAKAMAAGIALWAGP